MYSSYTILWRKWKYSISNKQDSLRRCESATTSHLCGIFFSEKSQQRAVFSIQSHQSAFSIKKKLINS